MAFFLSDDDEPMPTDEVRAFMAQERIFWKSMADSPSLHDSHCARCHHTQCTFTDCPMVACSLGCHASMHACKLDEHEALVCCYGNVPCLNALHGCPVEPQRRFMARHLLTCPANLVVCKHSWYGTTTSLRETSLQSSPVKMPGDHVNIRHEDFPPTPELASPRSPAPVSAPISSVPLQKWSDINLVSPSTVPLSFSVFSDWDTGCVSLPNEGHNDETAAESSVAVGALELDSASCEAESGSSSCIGICRNTSATAPSAVSPACCANTSGTDDGARNILQEEPLHLHQSRCSLAASGVAASSDSAEYVTQLAGLSASPSAHPLYRFMSDDLIWRSVAWPRAASSFSVRFTADKSTPIRFTADKCTPIRVAFKCYQVFRRSEYGAQVANMTSFFSQPPLATCPMSTQGCQYLAPAIKLQAGCTVFPLCTSNVQLTASACGVRQATQTPCSSSLEPAEAEEQPSLTSLPTEVLRLILGQCDSMTLRVLALTCCYLRAVSYDLLLTRGMVTCSWTRVRVIAPAAGDPAEDDAALSPADRRKIRRWRWEPEKHFTWAFSNGVSPVRDWSRAFPDGHMRQHVRSCPLYNAADHTQAAQTFNDWLSANQGSMAGEFSSSRLKHVGGFNLLN